MKGLLNRCAVFRTKSTRCARAWNAASGIEGFSEFQVGDAIECYTMEKVAQKL